MSTLVGTTALALANNVHLNSVLNLPVGSNALTLDGVIDGTGSLNKTGSGTLTLNGVNTYGGGTVLAAGTLAVGNGSALAAAP
ncbi:hypothetical protein CSV86_029555 [Pseudomonas putida CSV86]|uniref:Uncharacterized protein n=1 Tax=Pseudomonas bharatica CSV86 TaxID=1005395 RepID=A0A7K4ENE5_9PSED|nr:autotransporter-associated beta strand repeat-containing protein [Pseudomonas bharatica]NNJ18960.1 hypothetical protein [Pseudomonas bharatica CSV86]